MKIINLLGNSGTGKTETAKSLAKHLQENGLRVLVYSYANPMKYILETVMPGIRGTQEEKATKILVTKEMADEITHRAFNLAWDMSEILFETKEESEYFFEKLSEDFSWIPLRGEYWTPRKLLIEIADTFKGVHADCILMLIENHERKLAQFYNVVIYDDARYVREVRRRAEPFNILLHRSDMPFEAPSTEVGSEYLSRTLTKDVVIYRIESFESINVQLEGLYANNFKVYAYELPAFNEARSLTGSKLAYMFSAGHVGLTSGIVVELPTSILEL